MQVVWFKRDLRTIDHVPLQTAFQERADKGPLVALYVHEPGWLSQPYVSALHQQFTADCLNDLHAKFEIMGGTFNEAAGDILDVLGALWKETRFTTLWSHQEVTTLWGFERDKKVAAWCKSKNITWNELPQNGIKRGGLDAHREFNFEKHLNHSCFLELSSLEALVEAALGKNSTFHPSEALMAAPIPTISPQERPRGVGPIATGALRGGMQEADRLITRFFQLNRLLAYPSSISSPNTALTGCSRLSAYLAYGVVSDRYSMQRLNAVVEDNLPLVGEMEKKRLLDAAKFYADRLYWRSAYGQKMEMHPVSEVKCDLPVFEGLRESEELEGLYEAWTQGTTGFPMVDAAVRNLNQTGWIPMRMRGMITSFALNELWIPWKKVAYFLAQRFTDFEPFIHFSQIQIHGGSSRLSGPLTYHVLKQQADHDPNGVYVRRWCPELRDVPDEYLAEPFKMPAAVQAQSNCIIGKHYLAPVVHLSAAHDAARLRVAALREGKPVPVHAHWKQRALLLNNQTQGSLF